MRINNALIRTFNPCYDPSEIVSDENETLSVYDWIIKYRNKVKRKNDIIWLILRKDFMLDKDLRLFTVWCAREVLKLVKGPDSRSINACDVAERYTNGEASDEELNACDVAERYANASASDIYYGTYASCLNNVGNVDHDTYYAARNAGGVAYDTYYAAQIDKLLTYFK